MPRSGWTIIQREYKEEFGTEISLQSLKKHGCEIKEDPNQKRQKISTPYEGINSVVLKPNYNPESEKCEKSLGLGRDKEGFIISKISKYSEAKTSFDLNYEKIKRSPMEEWRNTKKIISSKVDVESLNNINAYIGCRVSIYPPKDMEEIARLIYTAQVTYQEITNKVHKVSKWKENTNRDIESKKNDIELLDDLINSKKVEKGERKRIKKLVRKLGFDIHNFESLKLAKEEMRMKSNALTKRIEMYDKRVQYNRENSKFELYRGKFYRELKEEERSNCEIGNDEISEYWRSIWKGKKDMNKEELKEFMNFNIDMKIESEILIEESVIEQILKGLSNWKACGIDRIYNYFIKQMTSLWPHIISLTKLYIESPENAPEWLYTGLTILLPKETPNHPSPTYYLYVKPIQSHHENCHILPGSLCAIGRLAISQPISNCQGNTRIKRTGNGKQGYKLNIEK